MSPPVYRLSSLDAVAYLQTIPDASIDLVITDPAYESLERHRAKGTTTRLAKSTASSNAWFEVFANARVPSLFDELYRVMRPQTHAYILCDDPTDEVYRAMARDAGFWVWKSLTWLKTKAGHTDAEGLEQADIRAGMGYHWRNCRENILFLEKRTTRQVVQAEWTVRKDPRGKGRQLANKGWPDCLACPPIRNGYPTEKPVALLAKLVENSSVVGEIVLDPFFGSGSTGVAALEAGRHFLGSDTSDAAHAVANPRLRAAQELH